MESKIVLDSYIISDVRGEADGGLAAGTFEAEEVSTGEKVIVELMPAASLMDSVRARLEAEALAAKRINHINIPRLYDFGFENDQFVYVTEHFDGITFEAWVREHGAMPVEAVLRVALQIVRGLGTAAFYKIFHHAINPSNLVIVPGRTLEGDWPLVKIIHFLGVAPTLSAADVSAARFDNSATFASPEQLEQGTVDFRSEIFSLGCTLWFLLTGAAPFALPGDPAEGAPARMSLAVERLNETPKQLRRLLGQMLATNPDERPLDPIALEAEIRKCLADGGQLETTSQGIAVAPLSGTQALETPIRRRLPAKMLALAALLLIVATIAALTVPGFRPSRIWEASNENKPIGVPIGIQETKTKPAIAQRGNDKRPNATDREGVPTTNSVRDLSAPKTAALTIKDPDSPITEAAVPNNAAETSSTLPAAMAPPAVASANQIDATPMRSASSNPPASTAPEQRPVPLVASEVPAVPKSGEPAPPAEGPPKVATATETPPAPESADKTSTISVPEPLPNPPVSVDKAEALGDVAATSSTPSSSKNAAPGRRHRQVTASDSFQARTKTHDLTRLRRGGRGRLRFVLDEPGFQGAVPRGVARARFVGTTPDGMWMLALPSHEIVVVPPPPGY